MSILYRNNGTKDRLNGPQTCRLLLYDCNKGGNWVGMQQNMSNVIRTLKELNKKSMSEFAEELEISRSTLQEYLSGTGNPRLSTVEHLAKKLQINPIFLVSGLYENQQLEVILLLLNAIEPVAMLSKEKKERMAELIMEIVSLWEDEP